jgi:glutaredoxin
MSIRSRFALLLAVWAASAGCSSEDAASPATGVPPTGSGALTSATGPAAPPDESPASAPEPPEAAGERPAPGPQSQRTYYRWIDASGALHLVDSLDAIPEADRSRAKPIVVEQRKTSPADAASRGSRGPSPFARHASTAAAKPAPEAEVVIYTAKWCGWCRKALDHLDSRGVSYRNRDIEDDPEASRDLRHLTGSTSIPVLEIDGELVRGFDVARIDSLLDASR